MSLITANQTNLSRYSVLSSGKAGAEAKGGMEEQAKHRLKNINREEVMIVLKEIIYGTSEMEASVLNIPHNRVSSHFQNSSLQARLFVNF